MGKFKRTNNSSPTGFDMLSPEQKAFITAKVKELGDELAVESHYKKSDLVGRYARKVIREWPRGHFGHLVGKETLTDA